jgi:uncharacterized protein DUF4129
VSARGRLAAAVVAALALAAPATAPAQDATSPAEARRQAREILDERRFHGADLPRPFAGPLEWLGDRLEPVLDWFDDLGEEVPGGPFTLWLILSCAVIALAGRITTTSIGRRAIAIERARAAALPKAEDPHALERAADRAERDGDWELAVRLRFRAGLLRLDRRRVIEYRPSLTTGEVARAVSSPAFSEVGERFDAIAYGGRPAEREDAEHARRGWAEVLAR